jgi:o-succinylbenzoate---CoA ligase
MDWLGNVDRLAVGNRIEERRQRDGECYITIDSQCRETWIGDFLWGMESGLPIVIYDPNWGTIEREYIDGLIRDFPPQQTQIIIPTGGSSGKLKLAVHTWESLQAAVVGFQEGYGFYRIDSICTLPLHHVSGLMQLLRAFYTGGSIVFTSYPDWQLPENCYNCPERYFLSLVSTQFQRIVDRIKDGGRESNNFPNLDWWRSLRAIVLGGSAVNPLLLDTARSLDLPIALTYGSTETAAQISALFPNEFRQGIVNSGKILPHAIVAIEKNQSTSQESIPGNLVIKSKSLFCGYYPCPVEPMDSWINDDLGYLDREGFLTIVGRSSNKIISGGEKIFAEEVEAAIQATGLVRDICVLGKDDRDWGERVIACYVPIDDTVTAAEIESHLTRRLARYKHPKDWYRLDAIVRNDRGKVDRHTLRAIIENLG